MAFVMTPYTPVCLLIFDLGDVLFQWSRSTKTSISPKTLQEILNSTPWLDYECGRLTQVSCYDLVARRFRVDVSQVAETFKQARASLHPGVATVAFLKSVRNRMEIKVYAMSNVAKEDFAVLGDQIDPNLFDGVFTSGSYGIRKPQPDFYRRGLEEIGFDTGDVVFIDDRIENVDAALGLGTRSLVFDKSTITGLEGLLFGPIARAYQWLYKHRGNFESVTDSGVRVGDNFAKLLIAEANEDI